MTLEKLVCSVKHKNSRLCRRNKKVKIHVHISTDFVVRVYYTRIKIGYLKSSARFAAAIKSFRTFQGYRMLIMKNKERDK